MDNLLTVVFEAHNAAKNHHRTYRLTLGRDLLDHWTLAVSYGRVGAGGQLQRFASPSPEAMRKIIRERLSRRLSAPRRIDCHYQLAAVEAATGFEVSPWLPGEVLARFRDRN